MISKILKRVAVVFMFALVININLVNANEIPPEEKQDEIPVTPVSVHLDVETDNEHLFNDNLDVMPCDNDNDGTISDTEKNSITAYCALVQSGLESDWSGKWVNSIHGLNNNVDDNGVYWMWLANLNIKSNEDFSCDREHSNSCSAKEFVLVNNDKILFYYNTNPLDIFVDNATPAIGSSIKISVKELGSWGSAWNPAAEGKIIINEETYDLDVNGEYSLQISDTNPISIKGVKASFIDSQTLTITGVKPVEEIPDENQEENDSGSGSGGGGGRSQSYQTEIKTFSVQNAVNYLLLNQNVDGSFGSMMYTDWVAIAAKAGNSSLANSISSYLLSTPLISSLPTDNERHAMALMSLGINPYNGTDTNYIKKITDSFNGAQFGSTSLDNDDIFALIALRNAGYTDSNEMISKDIDYLISKQSPDGSWGSVDMTAAGIQALEGFGNYDDAVTKAKDYLILVQEADGGFANTFSTSWSLQAMLGDNRISKAEGYLSGHQQNDGGMEDVETGKDTRIWSTAYAIPAILRMPWRDIMEEFEIPASLSNDEEEIEIKLEEPTLIVLEKKEVPISEETKLVKSVKIAKVAVKKEINKVNLITTESKEEIDNPLLASVVDSNQNINNKTFLSVVHRIIQKISAPFVWLWVNLGF